MAINADAVNISVGEDFVSVQTADKVIPAELMRFHSVEGAYQFFYTGLQAILAAHPRLEEFDFGEKDGTKDSSG